jgi:hypothetical protein
MNICSLRGVLSGLLIGAPLMLAAVTFAQSRGPTASTPPASALPDVVGLRTGISAQEAYDFLKARGPKASIGIGQFPVAGVSEKPVPVSMSVRNTDLDPVETITVWLTTPPSKQVVFAVGRKVEYEESKQLLKSTVRAGLLQKYGPELDDQSLYWAFDEQGKRIEGANQISANCKGRANWSLNIQAPEGASYAFFTPLLYTPGPVTICDSAVEVRVTLDESPNRNYVTGVTVLVSNRALARRTQDAYQALLSNNAAAQQKEELEKAKQQKGPTF